MSEVLTILYQPVTEGRTSLSPAPSVLWIEDWSPVVSLLHEISASTGRCSVLCPNIASCLLRCCPPEKDAEAVLPSVLILDIRSKLELPQDEGSFCPGSGDGEGCLGGIKVSTHPPRSAHPVESFL